MYDDDFPQYISVSQQIANAKKRIAKLQKQGYELRPIEAFSRRKIAQSFWGHAWCRHLEQLSDYENRLPRGRSYLRNGSVLDLKIESGKVIARVSGSEIYEIEIDIDTLPEKKWSVLKKQCSGKIGSLIELLQGKLSDEIMSIVTAPNSGLFPSYREIHLNCNCPDYADLCKHLAAVLYGIGARLDEAPELLFLLRGIDHTQLIDTDLEKTFEAPAKTSSRRIASTDLSNIFGVDLDTEVEEPSIAAPVTPTPKVKKAPRKTTKKTAKKVTKKKAARKRAKPIQSTKTGTNVRKLRRQFGMSEYEFGLIIDTSAITVEKWESYKKLPHNANAANQAKLQELAQLTPAQAQQRLNEYR